MSRRGIKTINLPEDTILELDSALAGAFAIPLSRDEAVRHAVTILLIGIKDMVAGRRPLGRMQAAIEAVPGLRPPIGIPPEIQATARLMELVAKPSQGQHWRLNLVHEVVRQLVEANPQRTAKPEDAVKILEKLQVSAEDTRQAIERLCRQGPLYPRGDLLGVI